MEWPDVRCRQNGGAKPRCGMGLCGSGDGDRNHQSTKNIVLVYRQIIGSEHKLLQRSQANLCCKLWWELGIDMLATGRVMVGTIG